MKHEIKRGLLWIGLQIFVIVSCILSVLALNLRASGLSKLLGLLAR